MEWKIAADAKYPNGYIEGYISVKHAVDTYGDTVVDGAYEDPQGFISHGFASVGHSNGDLPVCYIESAQEDAKGFFVRAPFHSTKEAQDARKVCEERDAAGKPIGLSIDYYTLDHEYKTDGQGRKVRILKKIRVIGFAIVNNPAERGAAATDIKSGGRPNDEQFKSLLAELEDWTGREEWIAENRKQGLTAAHKDRIAAITSRLDALVEIKAETQAEEEAPLGAIYEIEQFAATLQGATP